MKQTIDSAILQCDAAENFSSCIGIAGSCPGMKTKEPKSSVFYGNHRQLEAALSPGLKKRTNPTIVSHHPGIPFSSS